MSYREMSTGLFRDGFNAGAAAGFVLGFIVGLAVVGTIAVIVLVIP